MSQTARNANNVALLPYFNGLKDWKKRLLIFIAINLGNDSRLRKHPKAPSVNIQDNQGCTTLKITSFQLKKFRK